MLERARFRLFRPGLYSLGLSCLGLSCIGAALLAPHIGKNFIDQITAVASTFLGLLLGVYVLGMSSRRANTGGAVIGLAAGAAGIALVHLHPDIPTWWSGAFAFFPTLLVGWLASGLFPPPSADQQRGLFFQGQNAEEPSTYKGTISEN